MVHYEIGQTNYGVIPFFKLYPATKYNENNKVPVTAFLETTKVLFNNLSLIERSAKNLRMFQHPHIINFLSLRKRRKGIYMIVEKVEPVSCKLDIITILHLCRGLKNILQALVFLQEKGFSHNNVCTDSIFVTSDESWKLGGFELVNNFKSSPSTNKIFQDQRCKFYIDPNEEQHIQNCNNYVNSGAIDSYAFGVLVVRLLADKPKDEILYLEEFVKYCKDNLLNPDPHKRISLYKLLKHKFFNSPYIQIDYYLKRITCFRQNRKRAIIARVFAQLKSIPQKNIIRHLLNVIYTPEILLDDVANEIMVPYLMVPKIANYDYHLFSKDNFVKFVTSHIIRLFKMPDIDLKIKILKYMKYIITYFSESQLRDNILPELQLTLEENDETLVSETLITLSFLFIVLDQKTRMNAASNNQSQQNK